MIQNKALTKFQDNLGNTALHYACSLYGGNLELIKYLVEEKDANINALDLDKQSPLHLACQNGKMDTVKYLIEEKKSKIEGKCKLGRTLLHYACKGQNLDVIKYLVEEKGLSPKVSDKEGMTPLHLSGGIANLDIVTFLIEHENDDTFLFKKDNKGRSLLHHVCRSGRLEVLRYLIEEKKMNFEEVTS